MSDGVGAHARKPGATCMHSRHNPCPGAEFQGWHIHPVREYTDHDGGTFFEPCETADSLDDDNPEAVGPVLFGVYLYAISGTRAGEWMNIMDFPTYEEAIAFLDAVTGPVPEGSNGP